MKPGVKLNNNRSRDPAGKPQQVNVAAGRTDNSSISIAVEAFYMFLTVWCEDCQTRELMVFGSNGLSAVIKHVRARMFCQNILQVLSQ